MDSRTKKKRATKSHKYTFPINNSEPHANFSRVNDIFLITLFSLAVHATGCNL